MSFRRNRRKRQKAAYMKIYIQRVKANGGKKLDSKYGRRSADMSHKEFVRRFMVKENV